MGRKRILLLAGTSDARLLAKRLKDAGHEVMASLAGATKQPKPLPVPTRHGGFGGTAAQANFIADQGIDLVVDATHPFATRISPRTVKICAQMHLPYLRFSRPKWEPDPDEIWHEARDVSQLANIIPIDARVFLATGVQSREIAAALPGRVIYCRRVDDGPEPFALSGGWITGRPPFEVDAEKALFQTLDVSWVVAKNAGGPARAKLEAAKALGVQVAMIARPTGADVPTVHTLDEVLEWVAKQP